MERELVVWSSSSGPIPPPGNTPDDGLTEPRLFLEQIAAYPPNRLFLFKDFHPYLDDPRIVRRLRDRLPTLAAEHKTLLFIGPENTIPFELQKDALSIDLPLPGVDDLRAELSAVLQEATAGRLEPTADEEGRLLTAVSGLTANEAHRALSLVLQGRKDIDDDVFAALVAEIEESMGLDVRLRLMDPNMGASPTARREVTWQDEFDNAGLRIDLADRSEVGRKRVNQFLKPDPRTRRPRLVHHRRCLVASTQMKRFAWDEHRRSNDRDVKQSPKPKYDDFPALWRYLLNYEPTFRALYAGAPVLTRAGTRRGAY